MGRARGRRDHYVNGAFGEMADAEIALNPATPGAYEREIQSAADDGTGDGDQAADPLFGGFFAEFDGQAFGDAGTEFFNHLFFGKLFAEVNAGGEGSGEPEFTALVGPLGFKSVEQAEALDEAERDDSEQAGVGNQSNHATQAKTGALGESQALRVMDHALCDVVEALDGNLMHAAEIGNVKTVFLREIAAKVFRIDFDGLQTTQHAEAQKTRDGRASSGLV